MEQNTLLIPILRDFEKRARERPCTRGGLEALEGEFEEALGKARAQGGDGPPADTLETLTAADAVRVALRRGIVANERARSEILRIRQLIARGHVRAAVIESVKIRNVVAEFSDLSLDFVAEAQTENERRQQRLITLAVVLAAGILVVASDAALAKDIFAEVAKHQRIPILTVGVGNYETEGADGPRPKTNAPVAFLKELARRSGGNFLGR